MTVAGGSSPLPNLRPKVLECARRMTRVPLLPAAGQRLLEVSRMPADDVDLGELDRIVSHDPSMASRVLKVANSPHYVSRGTVSTVRQAIVVIGLTDLMSLLMVTSLMEGFRQDAAMTNLRPSDFWSHCVAVGSAARVCALHSGSDMLSLPEMNLAGLLHDIGKSVFIRNFPREMDLCIQRAMNEECGLLDAEAETFGITHAELGGVLASEWNLPEFVVQVARHHHAPANADEAYVRIARMVAWSDALALAEGIGASGNVPLPGAILFPGEEEPLEGRLNSRRTEVLGVVFQDLDLLSLAPEPAPAADARPGLGPQDREKASAEPRRFAPEPRAQPSVGIFARLAAFFFGKPPA